MLFLYTIMKSITDTKNEKKYNLPLAVLFQMVSFFAMFLYFSFLPTVLILSNFYFFLALIIFVAILSGLSMGIFNVYVTTLYQRILEYVNGCRCHVF